MIDKEEMQIKTNAARNANIFTIAQMMGYEFKSSGKYYMCKNNSGLVLFKNTNSFYDYYQCKGGSTIDFVMSEKNCNIRDAVDYINSIQGNEINIKCNDDRINRSQINKAEKYLVLPEKNVNHKRVFAYLTCTRKIDSKVVSYALHNHLVYESAEKHNAVFLGYDKNNTVKHGFLRGTITNVQFRGDISGSDKNYGFSVPGTDEQLVVFEAPIDLLSYMSMNETNHHLVALGMLGTAPIYTYIKEHPEIKKVSLILDNDVEGRNATQRFLDELIANGIEANENPLCLKLKEENVKDVNELLCKQIPELMKSKLR